MRGGGQSGERKGKEREGWPGARGVQRAGKKDEE